MLSIKSVLVLLLWCLFTSARIPSSDISYKNVTTYFDVEELFSCDILGCAEAVGSQVSSCVTALRWVGLDVPADIACANDIQVDVECGLLGSIPQECGPCFGVNEPSYNGTGQCSGAIGLREPSVFSLLQSYGLVDAVIVLVYALSLGV